MRNSGQRTNTIEELVSAIEENRDIEEMKQIILGIEDINRWKNAFMDCSKKMVIQK